ncbi:hypothetical protein FRB94_008688 [Tulasnella sp. JGI-2019a]|nr:hypothetical protein FRB94_008688 [Tulasnella sp. JGI-2019a]
MGSIFVLCILIPLNLALTGYETISVVQSDFNAVPDLWFWRFGNKPLPGTLCDPRILSVEDTVFTNYTLLPWTIDAISENLSLGLFGNANTKASIPTLTYSGHNLDNCDVIYLGIVGTLQPSAVTCKVIVACNDTDLRIMMSTAYTVDGVDLDEDKIVRHDTSVDIMLRGVVGDMSGSGMTDPLGLRAMWSPSLGSPNGAAFCHNQRLGPIGQSCTAVPISLPNVMLTLTWADGTVNTTTFSSYSLIPPNLRTTFITIAMQLMLTAARLDVGNVFPNNFLVYPNVINATITDEGLRDFIIDNSLQGLGDTSRPAVIASQYLCHFPQRESLGSAIISVLVATLSMFGSAWAVFLAVATYYEKQKHPRGNFRLPEYEMVKKDDAQEIVDGLSSQGDNGGEA